VEKEKKKKLRTGEKNITGMVLPCMGGKDRWKSARTRKKSRLREASVGEKKKKGKIFSQKEKKKGKKK